MALSNRFLSPRWHRQEPRNFYPASYEICRPSLHHDLDFVELVHVRHSSSDLSSSNSVATRHSSSDLSSSNSVATRHSSSELGSALAAPSLGSALTSPQISVRSGCRCPWAACYLGTLSRCYLDPLGGPAGRRLMEIPHVQIP